MFTVSYGDATVPDDDTRPSLRIAVGVLEVGPRILCADSPCTNCFATGGDAGTGCGYLNPWAFSEAGAKCDHGWLSRGGAADSRPAARRASPRPPGPENWTPLQASRWRLPGDLGK